MTSTPKISTSVALEGSGIVDFKKPTATVEEWHWVNVTKEIPRAIPNTTKDDAAANASATEEKAEGEAEKPDAEKAEADKAAPEGEKAAEETPKAESAEENSSENVTPPEPQFEVIQELKKKKHEKKLTLERVDYKPKPLSEAAVAEATKRVKEMIDA